MCGAHGHSLAAHLVCEHNLLGTGGGRYNTNKLVRTRRVGEEPSNRVIRKQTDSDTDINNPQMCVA